MTYDYTNELKKVRDYYEGDPLQKRFSALICGGIGAGKTFLLRTARKPIHIDSFDPGGTKCLREEIAKGDIVVDTRFESEDPFNPDKFALWMKTVDRRIEIDYFNIFGTYALDSASTWGDAIMGYQLAGESRAGEAPKWSRDYVPQKVFMTNYIKKLMRLPCDFIVNGHLREIEEIISIDSKTNIVHKNVEYRFYTTGQAVITIPLLFDEIYVLLGKTTSQGVERELLVDAQGKYIARSRLKANGKLDAIEPASIKKILKKIGLPYADKERLPDSIKSEGKEEKTDA